MPLKIYIKQAIQYNIIGQPIVYVGPNPYSLQPVINGTLATNRQWTNYGQYLDVTNEVSDLTELRLTWTSERNPDGQSTPGALQQKKAASGELTFEAEAYRLLKQWLVTDVSAPLNAVSVKIEDVGCGVYDDYMIKATDLRWCEEEDNVNTCVFDVTLKQVEDPLTCVERTAIADNWQGWFDATGAKKHPRFSYCNEQRPNGILVFIWWLMAVIIAPLLLVLLPVILIINALILVINVIIGVVNAVISIVGGNKIPTNAFQTIPYININDILAAISDLFIESAGCGREHPAPLIRDYILNACMKCNIQVDSVTAPVFFSRSMAVETSSRGIVNSENPHYNACYFYAPLERGIRRNDPATGNPNLSQYYIPDNAPLLTLNEFLDELKALYNSEWQIKNVNGKPTLYFQRKDFYLNGGYLLDFTQGADRLKLLEGICFEWDTVKYPVRTEGLYTLDPVDTAGNGAIAQMNSLLSFDPSGNNPVFSGNLNKVTNYGATRFRLDGGEDYLYDTFQISVNAAFLIPFVASFMFGVVGDYIQLYCDYALLMTDETANLPKVIIWDGASYENAKAVRSLSAWPIAGYQMPSTNGKYNNTTWQIKHPPNTRVRGQGFTLPPFYPGYYTVTGFFGGLEIKQPALLPNYPMYFEPGFYDTMWDWFHWIDDPRYNPKLHQTWEAKIGLCCDDLKLLGVFGGQNIALNEKVKLPLTYFQDGQITEIEVNYSTEPPLGQHIILKGTV